MVRQEFLASLESKYIGKFVTFKFPNCLDTQYGIIDNINVEPDEDSWRIIVHINNTMYNVSWVVFQNSITIVR